MVTWREGILWTLSEPPPSGFVVGKDGRLARVGTTVQKSAGVTTYTRAGGAGARPGAAADALLAQAKAAGWVPPVAAEPGTWCGRCPPCLNGERSDCLRRGTKEAAAMHAADQGTDYAALVRAGRVDDVDTSIAQLQSDLARDYRARLEADTPTGSMWVSDR